jgi:hypothetical protein
MKTNKINRTDVTLTVIAVVCFLVGVLFVFAPTSETYAAPMKTTITQPDINAHSGRPDACRTYNIGGYDATDGLMCESEIVTLTHDNLYTVSIERVERPQDTSTQAQDNTGEDSTGDSIQDTNETPQDKQVKIKGNNGHGNNVDGVDCSNPGKSKQGKDSDSNHDDEKAKGKKVK